MDQTFGEYIIQLFNYGIWLGITLTIVLIIYYGINLLNSRGNPSAFSEAKDKIKKTLMGLAVLLLSFVLLSTINPELVNIDIIVDQVEVIIPNIINKEPTKELETYTFEEIPIGTIMEELLAGVSSINTPCYKYETRTTDKNGKYVLGDTIDQNKDGKIDENDVILNEDLFSCMKYLTDAYNAKIQNQLYNLTEELDDLMRECTCSRCYSGRYVGQEYPSTLGTYMRGYYCADAKNTVGYDYFCSLPYSYCNQCCGNEEGCPEAQPVENGAITNDIEFETSSGFTQYQYDPCPNRMEITCKKEEIQQLISGDKPSQFCYDEGLISEVDAESSVSLTLEIAIDRMNYYSDYYRDHLEDLATAKQKMKIPWGERLTLAELSNLQSKTTDYNIAVTNFEGYDISRYCDTFNSSGSKDTGICKLVDEERQYAYDGDSATFYFSADYNSKKSVSLSGKACAVAEGNMSEGEYSGIIPIGEDADDATEWGEEVLRRISLLIENAFSIYKEAENISSLSDKCNCQRGCKSGNDLFYCPGSYSCSDNECQCSVSSWDVYSCKSCVPKASLGGTYEYSPCFDRCSYGSQNRRIEKATPAPQYWVCPYEDFCDIIKNIYWTESSIDDACFESTENTGEQSIRAKNMDQIGYLQKFKRYSASFYELATNINAISYYANFNADQLIDSVCPTSMRKYGDTTLEDKITSCDEEESIKVENRFDILELLKYSREKLTGCVKGYSAGYKVNPTEVVQVFSCIEGIVEEDLIILPEFPYPAEDDDLGYDDPYNNCYPFNSDKLTEEQREICYYNPLREGDTSNPGCLLVTQEYMDNYYCCQ
ncbi:MAG: hypothetical protein WC909_03110 [Candidatus Paceibacterota bacterium]|jgi:hypothetical protein